MIRSAHPDSGTLGEREFLLMAEFIRTRSGIRMPPSKKSFLEGRLRRRLRRGGFKTMNDYCRWLFEEGGLAKDESALIDAVTTNKTDFFRERHHFQFLTDVVFPDFQATRTGPGRPLLIWSAGCSTGAEPYSLAMVCAEFARKAPEFDFDILASDVSRDVLQTAARAIYPHSAIAPVSEDLRKRYLLHDPDRGEVRIVAELRRKVRIAHHNLLHEPYPVSPAADIVFCRNVLIYFDRATQGLVLSRLCRYLRPGGYLFLGHSEGSIADLNLPLRAVGPTTFLREEAR